jgi:hypothetical protein
VLYAPPAPTEAVQQQPHSLAAPLGARQLLAPAEAPNVTMASLVKWW